ncbi:hypothetical protein GGR52DRAFT_226362 [Hypoxylon sp. FL1284]|nr:hypothetical protein GGR52DRAFT_226362 [Hypoxylon sp. FL1284]
MVTTRSAASKSVSPSPVSASKAPAARARAHVATWAHAPTRLTMLWLAVSLPLVTWDSGYVLLRPWTMEGGPLHWPVYAPYKLYGEVDHVYGWRSFEARSGFPSAQGALNVVETAMYCVYLYLYYTARVAAPAGQRKSGGPATVFAGRPAAVAVLTLFSACVMTLSKTVLYWLQEFFSDYEHIGHNNLFDLVVLWIIPNGLWLVFPTYIIYVLSADIVEGLTMASMDTSIKSE